MEKIIIVNGNIVKNTDEVNDLYNKFGYQPFFTKSASEASDLILDLDPKIIEIVGGDGTYSSTLNEVLKSDDTFLEHKLVQLIPAGSGNDKSRIFGKKNILSLLKKHLIDSDFWNDFFNENYFNELNDNYIKDDFLLATINNEHERFVFNVGGLGLDSQTLIEYNEMRNEDINPLLKYYLAANKAIDKLNGFDSKLYYNTPEESGTLDSIMFLFMAGKYFGSGMPINKKCQTCDGKFEMVSLKKANPLSLQLSLMSLSLLKMGQKFNPLVRYLKPSSEADIKVQGNGFYFESDGEILKDVVVNEINVKAYGKINYLV